MYRIGFTVLAAACLASVAHAQVLTIGSSIGKECYNAAVLSQTIPIGRESACDEAINARTLDKRNLAATHINRGIIRMRASKFDGALADYQAASELRPGFGAIYLNQGAALIGAGRPGDAIASLNKALDLDTQDPEAAHYNLGLAHELTGDVTSAYYAFAKALEIRPDWQLAKDQLARFTVTSEG